MPRQARKESESGFHHVTMRGAGRRRIFEEDADRHRFVDGLRLLAEKGDVGLLAWCLMDNHVHVLAKAATPDLSRGFHRLTTSYAQYFNGRYGHVGPVFQDRFDSFPVETEAHLLATVRYIHLNPLDLRAAHPRDYPWSSYREYIESPHLCDTSIALDLLGGREAFVEFCDPSHGRDYLVDLKPRGSHLSDAEAKQLAVSYFGIDFADKLPTLDKNERDRSLHRLKSAGLSIRQLERLTGIGRNIIARA